MARARGRRIFEGARQDRRETAIICTYLANAFSSKRVTFKSVMSKMEILDPEEEKNVQVYEGSLLDQLEQHTARLKAEGKL